MKRRAAVPVTVVAMAPMASSLACPFSVPERVRIWRWEHVRGSGDVVEEIRSVSGFDRVVPSGVDQLYVERGDREALRIEAEDNLMRYIETEVDGRTLEISTDRHGGRSVSLMPREPIRLYLRVKELKAIVISGVGRVDAGEMEAERFSVRISGGGDIDIDGIEADALEVDISGVGDLNIQGGEVAGQEIGTSGDGSYYARDLKSASAEVNVGGPGSTTVWASEHLEVRISGRGNVEYAGNPRVHQDISGLGRVQSITD